MVYKVVKNSSDILAHHGILGQKWGVRRYQNADGSLTAAGRKRYYADVKKAYNKTKDPSRPYYTSKGTREIIETSIKKTNILDSDEIKKDINELTDLKEKWKELDSKSVDFFDSKACEEASKIAYDKTYKWFEKNNPEYLNTIIKNNNGEKAGLDGFHDFRKLYEGFEDEEWDTAEYKWQKTSEGKARVLADKAWGQYYDKLKEVGGKVSNELLGKYSDKKLNVISEETYGDLINEQARSILTEMANKKI